MTFGVPKIFDRTKIRAKRERSARLIDNHDFLHQRVADDIINRLQSINRTFDRVQINGAGTMATKITNACDLKNVITTDLSSKRLTKGTPSVVYDEDHGPFRAASFDLIISILTLHTVNDFVGAIAQAKHSLVADGLFIAAIFGENTLINLKSALYNAETTLTDGANIRFAPMAAIQDCGQALSRAGLALPVVDLDDVDVTYGAPMRLLKDLRGIGETNPLQSQSAPLRRDVLAKTLEFFQQNGGTERFDIVYLTGWSPDESQQKPLRPGSGKVSFEDAVQKF